MIRKANAIGTAVLLAAVSCNFAQGQSPSQTTLVIDLQHVVSYHADVSDPLKFATNPNVSLLAVTAALSAVQAQQYVISTYAGGPPATEPVPATNAAIGAVQGVAADPAGNVYFNGLNCVFKLDPRGSLTRVAGTSYPGYSGDGGPAINAQVNTDNEEGGAYAGVAVDRDGNLYITDPLNFRVRRVSPDGTISTVAGDGTSGYSSGLLGDGGPATRARLSNPAGIAVDASGNLYIADPSDSRIRKISPDGIISTVAGDGAQGFSGDGGPATSAHLKWPIGVAVDGAGNLYIGDSGNSRIRRIDGNGIISTMAGDGTPASSGDGGPAAKAQLNYPAFVAVDSGGNVYITTGDRVRWISPDGVITTVAGDGTRGYSGDGGPAIDAPLSYSLGVAADGNGNLYIADGARLRKVSQAGVITTVAGNGKSYYGGDNGPAAGAQIGIFCCQLAGGVAVDREGSLYLAETWNSRVRKFSPEGIITTVAGNGAVGFSGDGGPASNAQMAFPVSVAVDAAGTLYIADTWNFRVRKVSKEGIITTVAGNGTQGHSGDGGDARNAQIGFPFGLAIGADGSLYIADILSVRKVAPDGVISTLASFYAGAPVGSGMQDGNVLAVAVDSAGNVYATDHIHDRILRISPAGGITRYAGTGVSYGN
jgi:trimeric autotransporter adhesin